MSQSPQNDTFFHDHLLEEGEKKRMMVKEEGVPGSKVKEEKYLVLKLDDIEKYLTGGDKILLTRMCVSIANGREKDGKKQNHYVVVNEEEPYAEKVWDLILETKPSCYGIFDVFSENCRMKCQHSQECFDTAYGKGPRNLPGECSR